MSDPTTRAVHLTVNGEARDASVSARTQLAELLRDHLHLTGTHLGCEQGVCGACTVLLDGRPVRSCIAYAHACDGAEVVTVEGLGREPVGDALREAFSRHHALQCGYCTPGMLVTAFDVVTRLGPCDEATIRRELSGNLCRCTGYMGIVAAVREVAARQVRETAPEASGGAARSADAADDRPAFDPFEIDEACLVGAGDVADSARATALADGFSFAERAFTIAHPVEAVWSLFADLSRVARCIPGVSVDHVTADRFRGDAAIRFGPIRATFEGEGVRTIDPEQRVGTIAGTGSDARGHARLETELRYAMAPGVAEAEAGPSTRVEVAIRFRVQGGLAQFNRADLVSSFIDVMLEEFVQNCDRLLAGAGVREDASLSAIALLWRMIKSKLGL